MVARRSLPSAPVRHEVHRPATISSRGFRQFPALKGFDSSFRSRRASETAIPAHFAFHDLRHTFGPGGPSGGRGLEDRRDRLGHKGPDFTTHYSGAEIGRLLEAARWNWPGQLGQTGHFHTIPTASACRCQYCYQAAQDPHLDNCLEVFSPGVGDA